MAFYMSSLNRFLVFEIAVQEDVRKVSDFLIPINEQEYYAIKRTPKYLQEYLQVISSSLYGNKS